MQNENTYNADGGADMGQPISETFLRDQIVNGVKAGSESAVGKVIENATGTRLSVFEYSSPVINTESVPDAFWTGIAYGLDHFVSCGHGKIMYATDPTGPWTAYSPPALENWKGIAYGNGKFVCCRFSKIFRKKIMYASDPKGPWTLVTAPNQNNWTNVDFVNGYFVATSGDTTSNKQLIYATDPAGFWTEVQMPESASWTGVAYGNGILRGNKQFLRARTISSTQQTFQALGKFLLLSQTTKFYKQLFMPTEYLLPRVQIVFCTPQIQLMHGL